ncbi:ATP phosphoribosyltransferase [Chloroflexota bacterium]
MRLYRTKSQKFPNLLARVFHEKDIPIQVAIGNYDLGICGLDWIEELIARYPSSALLKVKKLGYGKGALYMAASRSETAATLDELQAKRNIVRIVSEYPNLAESFALKNRLRRFSVFPLWGASEVYPPENADLALIPVRTDESVNNDLMPISKAFDYSAVLIANRSSWESKDMCEILVSIYDKLALSQRPSPFVEARQASAVASNHGSREMAEDVVRLALPDGHQQVHTLCLLNKAGIQVDDYPSETGNRRPKANLTDVMIKVIRPQDMPLQVANGNFDLAVTGRDWLTEHLYSFPSSPVKELLSLNFGRVKIVAVISRELSAEDVQGLRQLSTSRATPLSVASEYINIADKYARDNRLGHYRVVPSWGASEAFLPEDADLLIENTETGRTIARHNLKIIDTLFVSSACLIGNSNSVNAPGKRERIKSITQTMKAAVEDI